MEYIGNRPPGNTGGYDPYDTGGYWWNYNNPYGAYDPYGYNYPVTSWEDQIAQSGGTAPTQPDVDANGNPIFRTDVVDTAPPVETTGSDIGQLNPYLNEYLASLPQGQIGGTGANFSTTGWDVADWGGVDEGGDPKFETTTWDTTDPDDPIKRGDYKTYWDFPTQLPDYKEPLRGWPDFTFTPNPPPGTGTGKEFPVTIKIPPFPPKTQPPKTQTGGGGTGGGGQQQQKPGVGGLLAALPMLAAFQGGTTTTPAPYAHLGPHTAVAPVFKPQGRGNPIPSIGQLLAGVK